MTYASSPYRRNFPQWLKLTGLFLILFLQYFVSGFNGDIGARVTSYFGLDSNKVSFYLHLGTVGMLAILPLTYRFRSYFKRISLLMWGLGVQLLISVLCYSTDIEFVLMISSFVMGAVKILVLLDLLSLFIGMFPILRNRGIFYGVLYGVLRSVREVATYVSLKVIENYGWRDVFIVSIIAVLLTILLCLYLFESRRSERKIPLYQAEWGSMLLMVIMGVSLCYTLIIGQELDWWSSDGIILSASIFVISTVIFIYRQFHIKRPYWDLRIFSKYKQISIGASLMLVMYIFYSTSTLFNRYIDYNFQGEENYLAHFGIIHFVCYLIFFPIVGFMIYKNVSRRLMISIGFLCFAFSLLDFSFIIQENLTFWDLMPAVITSGIGYAFLLTNSAAYLATNISRKDNRSRVMVTISARYVVGSFMASSLFSNWIYHRESQHSFQFLEKMDFTNSAFMHSIVRFSKAFETQGTDAHHAHLKAMGLIKEKVQIASMLLTIQEIAYLLGILAIIIAVIVLFMRSFELHKKEGKNKYRLTPW